MKTKVGIIFGGCSSEYDVSLVSVTSVIKNINKDRYNKTRRFLFISRRYRKNREKRMER